MGHAPNLHEGQVHVLVQYMPFVFLHFYKLLLSLANVSFVQKRF